MVFSFNFGAAAPNEEQKKEESLGDEKPSDISWRKAEEIFLDDTHLCALGWTNILGVELDWCSHFQLSCLPMSSLNLAEAPLSTLSTAALSAHC